MPTPAIAPLKIVHLSDLHFCHQDIGKALDKFQQAVHGAVKKLPLHIHRHDEEVMSSLRNWLSVYDPDVILITGDITTFGDTNSFQLATDWLKPLRARTGKPRFCIVVPGNHDGLEDHISKLCKLYDSLPRRIRFVVRPLMTLPFFRLRQWGNLLTSAKHLGNSAVGENVFLKNYYNFIQENDGFVRNNDLVLPLDATQSVNIITVDSVSRDAAMVNQGEPTGAAWQKINDLKVKPGQMLIAALHHNPVPSPHEIQHQLTHAYNSMRGGTRYLKRLQEVGCDLMCFGHEHKRCLYSLDFDLSTPGHTYALGSPASSARDGGFNTIEISDINHARVSAWKYSDQGGLKVVKEAFFPAQTADQQSHIYELTMEHNRPTDIQTRSVRLEIKSFSEDEKKLFDELGDMDAELIYICGRHLKDLVKEDFATIKKLISTPCRRTNADRKVRILTNSADLLQGLVDASGNDPSVKSILGNTEDLKSLSHSVNGSSQQLLEWVKQLSIAEQRRIDVRSCFTLVPFGAYAVDPHAPWGKMVIKLLPMGAIKQFKTPCMRVNRRRDSALFAYYLRHLKTLMSQSKQLNPVWACGGEDLA